LITDRLIKASAHRLSVVRVSFGIDLYPTGHVPRPQGARPGRLQPLVFLWGWNRG